MNGLNSYIAARRVACEHDDSPPTIRGDALPTEPCGMLLDEPGDYEPTLPNCVGIVGVP